MVGINEGVDGFADVVDDPLPIDDVNAIGEAGAGALVVAGGVVGGNAGDKMFDVFEF